jgi:hypothetical protein
MATHGNNAASKRVVAASEMLGCCVAHRLSIHASRSIAYPVIEAPIGGSSPSLDPLLAVRTANKALGVHPQVTEVFLRGLIFRSTQLTPTTVVSRSSRHSIDSGSTNTDCRSQRHCDTANRSRRRSCHSSRRHSSRRRNRSRQSGRNGGG